MRRVGLAAAAMRSPSLEHSCVLAPPGEAATMVRFEAEQAMEDGE